MPDLWVKGDKMEDRSGQPRSLSELRKTLKMVEECIVRDMFTIPPKLAVFLPTIREALMELIRERR